MVKRSIFYIVLFSALSLQLSAQINVNAQFKLGEELFNKEFYYDAVTEYKRLLFFDPSGDYEYTANYKIALSYKMGGKYDDAILHFIKAEKKAPDGNSKFESQIQIVRCNILRRTTQRSLELLNMMQSKFPEEEKVNEIRYWRGWTYLFADELKMASEQFGLSGRGKELKKICDNAYSEKYSVTFAKVISYILPGIGEIYAGEIVPGLISLGWNALFGFLTVKAFIENRILDGILIGDLLFLRFYSGNIQNAVKFAKEKNLIITNKALQYIQLNYRGIKP